MDIFNNNIFKYLLENVLKRNVPDLCVLKKQKQKKILLEA